ncbi:4-(cytidine 5'-diphospho)-2-C-methyl-D-erythritol kinase [Schnuerera sp. xch1]|uniref:4-(cytidine 5'-diphospho)-2-C-methyl-D-erythritol kinase n=1 Tax=Schnuerera sp. xch1 TaxID=2874283 RepID=UPI001CBB0902|nr:4-(cytidine 5'-diphospho)-2-C-methyl-D-erythritol kinase [Schnuerera sp. xch1]MBZ2175087.1 4-(cytidine 5'-diphospho)-2-C-methyl-D-erythritol kinase [Schnuerera sp. xch1]
MNEIVVDSFGKVNLALDVLYKRDDGYHEINTIMQQIDLKDTVTLRDRKKGIKIECNDKDVPLDHTNLVYKAWEKIVNKTGINRGIHIIIQKRIPVSAGLAGGSSNAAAVFKGLNILWNLKLSEEELMKMGLQIGADVPFCITGGTAWAKGIGEKLTKIKSFSNNMILLTNIGVPVSTAHVYDNLDLYNKEKVADIEKIVRYIEEDNIVKVATSMTNVLEGFVIKEYPIIKEIKKDMIEYGALGSIMSGSGPTVFGIFDDEKKLYNCKEMLEKKVEKVIVTRTI